MSAKRRAANGKRQRKKVLHEMKSLEKRIVDNANAHLTALKTRRHKTSLSEAQAQQIISRIGGVLEQLLAAIKQAHECIIGGRRIANEEEISAHTMVPSTPSSVVRPCRSSRSVTNSGSVRAVTVSPLTISDTMTTRVTPPLRTLH
jgi:hypothetical protein